MLDCTSGIRNDSVSTVRRIKTLIECWFHPSASSALKVFVRSSLRFSVVMNKPAESNNKTASDWTINSDRVKGICSSSKEFFDRECSEAKLIWAHRSLPCLAS